MASKANSADLMRLLSEGKTYLWALRHSREPGQTPERQNEVRALFAELGLDAEALAGLRELEHAMARYPHASHARPRQDQYQRLDLDDFHVYANGALCERGIEAGIELFPVAIDWSFCHIEVQYCTGGDTPMDATLASNRTESKRMRAGDVMVIPKSAHLTYHSSEDGERFGNAHIFLCNLGEMIGENYYDIFHTLRLGTLGIIPTDGEPIPFEDISDRVEVTTWSELLEVEHGADGDRPTWLRNGWDRREETRLLDYHEGTDSLVIAAPTRRQADYLPWGEGEKRCYVNPIVAEASSAICDTHFPPGYRRMLPETEVWTVLRGAAAVTQTTPPLHGETIEHNVEMGDLLVAAGGANVTVSDATDDFVVRRLAETCAHNQHAQMMELRLQEDGETR
jgi:hypothetical protein